MADLVAASAVAHTQTRAQAQAQLSVPTPEPREDVITFQDSLVVILKVTVAIHTPRLQTLGLHTPLPVTLPTFRPTIPAVVHVARLQLRREPRGNESKRDAERR